MNPAKYQIKDIVLTKIIDQKGHIDWEHVQNDFVVDTLSKANLYMYISVYAVIQFIILGIIISAGIQNEIDILISIYIFIGVFLFVSILFTKSLIMIVKHYIGMRKIQSTGVTSTAVIHYCIQAQYQPGATTGYFYGGLIHLLCYSFLTEKGEAIRLWSSCSLDDYKKVYPGMQFEIKYLPDGPFFHRRYFRIN
jgi:hypothetical protein